MKEKKPVRKPQEFLDHQGKPMVIKVYYIRLGQPQDGKRKGPIVGTVALGRDSSDRYYRGFAIVSLTESPCRHDGRMRAIGRMVQAAQHPYGGYLKEMESRAWEGGKAAPVLALRRFVACAKTYGLELDESFLKSQSHVGLTSFEEKLFRQEFKQEPEKAP